MTRRTPLTVVGGFLGAGKTTLLNHLLRNAGGRRLAVLINDFGSVNIDAELIDSRDGSVIRLSNGCICCSIGDSFTDALLAVTRRGGDAYSPDQIIIEASGVADPGRTAELAYLDPALTLQGVLVLVDAERVRLLIADKYVGDTVCRQIEAGDILILNKVDLIDERARQEIEHSLRLQAPHARTVCATEAKLPVEILLGFDEDHWGGFLRTGHQRPHNPADNFATLVFEARQPFRARALRALLDGLPKSVLRAKGFVITDDDPGCTAILQVVGRRWEIGRPLGPVSHACTRVVIIGVAENFDKEVLRGRLVAALA